VKPAAQLTILGIARWEKAAEQQSSYRGAPRQLVIQAPAGGRVEVIVD
jgi:hypothetical protein